MRLVTLHSTPLCFHAPTIILARMIECEASAYTVINTPNVLKLHLPCQVSPILVSGDFDR